MQGSTTRLEEDLQLRKKSKQDKMDLEVLIFSITLDWLWFYADHILMLVVRPILRICSALGVDLLNGYHLV